MKKQKFISKKWFIILGIALLLIPVIVYAQPSTSAITPASQLTGTFDEVFKTIAGLLTQVMRALQKILWPVMLAIGGLLGNDLLFGAGMEERLLEVWTQIRNLVNIAFVVILLGVALYNVIGFGKQDNFLLKTALPRIVIALIAVNFSFVAMKVILDVTNVLTVSIFALPASVSEDLKNTEIVGKEADGTLKVKNTDLESKICKSMFGDKADFDKRITSLKLSADAQKLLHCKAEGSSLVFTEEGRKFFAQYSPRNASLVMAVQLMNVVDVDKITQAASGGKFNLSDLSFTLLFSVVIYLLYAIAYVVLFVVLLVRMVVLWVFIALSPVVAISLAFPDLLQKAGSDFDFKDKFIKHAIAPIMIAVPMTLGYIMLDALKNISSGQIKNEFQLGALDVNTAGISDLQTMMVSFGAVAVVWVGVFAAARGTYAETLVEGIRSKLKTAGGTVFKAVKLLPLIPAGAGTKGRISITQASQLWKEPMKRLQDRYGGIGETGPVTARQITKLRTVQEARRALGREGWNRRDVQKALSKKIAAWRTGTGAQQNFVREVERKLQRGGLGRLKTGQLRRTELRGLRELGTKPPTPVRPTSGTTGSTTGRTTTPTAANIDDNMSYGASFGLVGGDLQKDYDALKKEKAKSKPNQRTVTRLEDKIRKNQEFKDIVAAKDKASGSLSGVDSSAQAYKRNGSDANKNALKAAIDKADKDLQDKAGIKGSSNADTRRKKILHTFVKKAGVDIDKLPPDIQSKLK